LRSKLFGKQLWQMVEKSKYIIMVKRLGDKGSQT